MSTPASPRPPAPSPAGLRDDELCATCGFTYAGHISNTGNIYPCWKPSGTYKPPAAPPAGEAPTCSTCGEIAERGRSCTNPFHVTGDPVWDVGRIPALASGAVGETPEELLGDIEKHLSQLVSWARDQQSPNYAREVEEDAARLVKLVTSHARALAEAQQERDTLLEGLEQIVKYPLPSEPEEVDGSHVKGFAVALSDVVINTRAVARRALAARSVSPSGGADV